MFPGIKLLEVFVLQKKLTFFLGVLFKRLSVCVFYEFNFKNDNLVLSADGPTWYLIQAHSTSTLQLGDTEFGSGAEYRVLTKDRADPSDRAV